SSKLPIFSISIAVACILPPQKTIFLTSVLIEARTYPTYFMSYLPKDVRRLVHCLFRYSAKCIYIRRLGET
ncbi:hypothetical protein Q0M53_13805, partial [Staphylococcus aureus]|nr:hypothetical protein [Staphylococcus aureus]